MHSNQLRNRIIHLNPHGAIDEEDDYRDDGERYQYPFDDRLERLIEEGSEADEVREDAEDEHFDDEEDERG